MIPHKGTQDSMNNYIPTNKCLGKFLKYAAYELNQEETKNPKDLFLRKIQNQ